MSRLLDEMREEAAKNASIEVTRQMLILGKNTIQEIAQICDLTLDEVTTLAATSQK